MKYRFYVYLAETDILGRQKNTFAAERFWAILKHSVFGDKNV